MKGEACHPKLKAIRVLEPILPSQNMPRCPPWAARSVGRDDVLASWLVTGSGDLVVPMA